MRKTRGRDPYANRKLTYEQAEELRAEYAAGGVYQSTLAKKYGINQSAVSSIIHRRSYTKPVPGNTFN